MQGLNSPHHGMGPSMSPVPYMSSPMGMSGNMSQCMGGGMSQGSLGSRDYFPEQGSPRPVGSIFKQFKIILIFILSIYIYFFIYIFYLPRSISILSMFFHFSNIFRFKYFCHFFNRFPFQQYRFLFYQDNNNVFQFI